MKEKPTGKASAKTKSKGNTTDWERLRSLADKDIKSALNTDPDANPTDVNFWKQAKIVLPQAKQTVTIRLDADLLGWLRRQKRYQTRINAVLRTYMEAQK
ncbi:MAG: BrnA antitoxin family protein [Acidobacteriota bacterium]